MSGDWYIKYRENMNLEYDLNGGTSGPNTTNFYAGFDCSLSLTKPYRKVPQRRILYIKKQQNKTFPNVH